MIIIGLTGNIASGKSSVAKVFRELGAETIDADDIARSVVTKGKPAWEKIVDRFGNSILDDNGFIDRKKLGQIVFNNKNKLQELMKITHPEILSELKERLKRLENKGTKCVVIEATLIDGNGAIMKIIDKLILVRTSEKNQLSRLEKRDNFSREESIKRIKSQPYDSGQDSTADYVISNESNFDNLNNQVIAIWNELFN